MIIVNVAEAVTLIVCVLHVKLFGDLGAEPCGVSPVRSPLLLWRRDPMTAAVLLSVSALSFESLSQDETSFGFDSALMW